MDWRSAIGVVRPRWLTELTREPSAVNPVAVGGILPTWPGACHMQSDALTPAGFSINDHYSGRISGEWGRRHGAIQFYGRTFLSLRRPSKCPQPAATDTEGIISVSNKHSNRHLNARIMIWQKVSNSVKWGKSGRHSSVRGRGEQDRLRRRRGEFRFFAGLLLRVWGHAGRPLTCSAVASAAGTSPIHHRRPLAESGGSGTGSGFPVRAGPWRRGRRGRGRGES